jgi:hypothetical protein
VKLWSRRLVVKRVPVIILWSVAFAFVESAVVEYLRAIYYPLAEGGFLFPVKTIGQLQIMGEEHIRRLVIEFGREAATLVMLATVGMIAATNRRTAWAYFMIAFGVWDIFYYVWLRVFLNWPPDIMTMDLLFLLPVPWVAPVLAPVLISIALVVSGLLVLLFETTLCPLSPEWRDWAFITVGGLIVIASFCWDYSSIMGGGPPNHFNWLLFFAGFSISTITFAFIVFRSLTGISTRPRNQ